MECRGRKLVVLALVMLLLTICYGQSSIIEGVSPLDGLPGYIKQVTHFGQRADSPRLSKAFRRWMGCRDILSR